MAALAICLACAESRGTDGPGGSSTPTGSAPTGGSSSVVVTSSPQPGPAGPGSSSSGVEVPDVEDRPMAGSGGTPNTPRVGTGQAGGSMGGNGGRGERGHAGSASHAGGTSAVSDDAASVGGAAGATRDAGNSGSDAVGQTDGGAEGPAAVPDMMIFLLLGQSNMAGQPQPESEDRTDDPRIHVLAFDNCPNLGREYNQWYTASPPLHNCDGGVGPGDWFARTLLPHLPPEARIGLVPLAINGAPIEVFRKGVPRPGWTLPPDDHWPTGYEWIMSRAVLAQETGTISGILFHQGESDATNEDWPSQVAQLVSDLRSDLGIGEGAPFIAGELLETGCCVTRNELIRQFPDQIPNAWVASSAGLTGYDMYHFDLPAQRELGKRYAEAMISAFGW